MAEQAGPRFGAGGESEAPECPRHPGRPAWVSCGRCGRPACPDCLVPAPVGMRCTDCVRGDARQSREVRTVFGSALRPDAKPVVTYGIGVLCIVLWIAQWVSSQVTEDLLFVPFLGLAEPWRFLTSGFVHIPRNPTHIAMNLLALWSVGRVLEPMLGWARYLVLYLLSTLAGSVAMVLAAFLAGRGQEYEPWFTGSLGASGAVFGLFGAYFVAGRRLGADTSWIVGLVVINAAFTLFFPGIAWEAHLGGMIVGAAVMALLALTGTPRRHQFQWPAMAGVLVLLILATVLCYTATTLPYLTL